MTSILMIDDDVALTQLVAEYLQLDGYEFKAVHQGPEGLELARSNAFQLVLLDIMLPGMDGLTVLKQLRQYSYCPVLMLTARGDEIDRVVGLELGADDYLAKPFSPRELMARIKALLRRAEFRQPEKESGRRIRFADWVLDTCYQTHPISVRYWKDGQLVWADVPEYEPQ